MGLRHLKYPGYQIHCRIIRMVLIAFIKQAQLLQIFKFIHLVFRLTVYIHLDLIPLRRLPAGSLFCAGKKRSPFCLQTALCLSLEHIYKGLLPVKLFRSRSFIVGF